MDVEDFSRKTASSQKGIAAREGEATSNEASAGSKVGARTVETSKDTEGTSTIVRGPKPISCETKLVNRPKGNCALSSKRV